MDAEAVRQRAATLPEAPGVYEFESGDTVLYVGKALDLADRVRSYADPRSERIRRMVDRADGIEVSVTNTETQALLLEANLVKRHQPRYNVRLKDDKSYPLVQLTDHEFPRIEITRDPAAGATVFGPFTDKGRVETVVKALRETYGARGCSDHKFAGRDRPCLDYEVGLCTAPCTGEISREDYVGDVTAVERFLDGETGVLADPLRRAMDRAAQNREYERAANLRDRLDAVETFHGGGDAAVAGPADDVREETVDVLGVSFEGYEATVARLHSEDGKLIERERHTLEAPDGADRAGDVLSAFVPQYYAERSLPDALLLSERLTDEQVRSWLDSEGVRTRVPGAGREATLVELALKNARRRSRRDDEARALAEELGLGVPARRIEAFDVSHAGGKAVVGSNVTFVDGSPEKSAYRRKKLPEGNDDYAAMCSLVGWRAERAVAGRDDRPTPDLLLVDGGRAQLEAARDGLDGTDWDVPAVALAKDEELVVTPDGTYDWPADADHLHLLQRARDEAHRFAAQYHQGLRDEVRTALDEVPGIGPALRRRLLRRFGSVAGVRDASVEELREVEGIGRETAETVRARL